MGIILENFKLFVLIVSFSAFITFIIIQILKYTITKYLLHEVTWLIQNTVFKSYLTFKLLVYTIIIVYVFSLVYFVITKNDWLQGLFFLSLILYFSFKISQTKKKRIFTIRDTFNFQKYSTAISYYNKQSEFYRRKSYYSIIERLKLMNLERIEDESFRRSLQNNFLPRLQNTITFRFYDTELYACVSKDFTGTLYYTKFYRSLLTTINRIMQDTNNLKDLKGDYQSIIDILLNNKNLRFNDFGGLHYDQTQIQLELEQLFNQEDQDKIVENKLLNISNSIEDLKEFIQEKKSELQNYETDLMGHKLEKILTLLESENTYKVYVLPDMCTVKDIEETILAYYRRNIKIKLQSQNISDIKIFVTNCFRNYNNKQRSRKRKPYKDVSFFVNHREEFYQSIGTLPKEFGLEKKQLAKIIHHEFPEISHKFKTIEGRL